MLLQREEITTLCIFLHFVVKEFHNVEIATIFMKFVPGRALRLRVAGAVLCAAAAGRVGETAVGTRSDFVTKGLRHMQHFKFECYETKGCLDPSPK